MTSYYDLTREADRQDIDRPRHWALTIDHQDRPWLVGYAPDLNPVCRSAAHLLGLAGPGTSPRRALEFLLGAGDAMDWPDDDQWHADGLLARLHDRRRNPYWPPDAPANGVYTAVCDDCGGDTSRLAGVHTNMARHEAIVCGDCGAVLSEPTVR